MCSSGKYHEEEHLKKVFKLNENKYLFILSFLHIFCFVQGCSCFILVLCLFFCLCERGNVIPEQEAQWNCLCTVDLYRFSADLDILNSSSCISVSLKKNPSIFFQTELPLLAQSAPVFQWRTLSLQRVCFLLQTLLSQLSAHNPRPWTRCSEPSAAPRGTKGKKGVSVPCGICPLTSLTFSCLEHRLCDLFPSDPFHWEGLSRGNTALLCVLFCDWLLILTIVQNGNRGPFLLSVFLVPLLLSVGSSCGIGDFGKNFPCSFPCLIKQWSGSTVLGPLCSVR